MVERFYLQDLYIPALLQDPYTAQTLAPNDDTSAKWQATESMILCLNLCTVGGSGDMTYIIDMSQKDAEKLVHDFVTCRLDSCNSLLCCSILERLGRQTPSLRC